MSRRANGKISKSSLAWRIFTAASGALFAYCIITFIVTALIMARPTYDREAAKKIESSGKVSKIYVNGAFELSGYLIDNPSSDRLLIYFYGINDDAASSMEMFLAENEAYNTFGDMDLAVVDWPSYGRSRGYCCDSSMKTAAVDVVSAFMRTSNSPANTASAASLSGVSYSCSDITIMGFSLGSGLATYAAAKCGCSDLILLSPYYSSADLYNNVIPFFYGPLKRLLGFSVETHEYAKDLDVRPLIAASTSDGRVPCESSLNLSESFENGCDLYLFDDLEHGSIPKDTAVLEVIRERLDDNP